jgi:hypothetical protein
MMKVALLTPEQAEQLRGKEVAANIYFNPVQDGNGDWIISLEEVEQSTIEWVKELPLIEYKQIILD